VTAFDLGGVIVATALIAPFILMAWAALVWFVLELWQEFRR
jgi:hypothetical protein